MAEINLSTTLCGVRFKNPILSGASELAHNLQGVDRLIKAGVGGVVTKTFTTVREVTRRPRPYQFSYRSFGKGYTESGSFYTMACPDCRDLDVTINQEIPKMSAACKKACIPFVVTFFCHFDNPDEWGDIARRFENAGADMLELNFSCPDAKKAVEEAPQMTEKIIEVTAKAVNIPIGPKIGPELEPLEKLSKMWVNAGAQYITAHNAPSGILIDLEKELPFGSPMISGYIPGRTFLPISLARVVRIHKALNVPVLGIGGIYTGEDAIQYIICGSPVVLICTAVFLKGTKVITDTVNGVRKWMKKKGYESIESFRGKVLSKIIPGAELKARAPGSTTLPPGTPYIAYFDHKVCTRCQDCARACDVEAISFDKRTKKMVVRDERCWSCGLCVAVCKVGGVKMVDRSDRAQVIWDVKEGMPRPFRNIIGNS